MTRLYVILSIALTAGALAVTLLLYPQMPDKIPTHWNIEGKIDGYGDKAWAAFLMPVILTGLLALFAALPWLSPKQFAVDTFRSTYWFIVLVVTAALVFIHGLTMWAALSGPVDITRPLLAGLLVMFGLMGNVLGKVRRNFYVGIRTPWTLASERVWNDTHRLAGRWFVAAAALGLVFLVLPVPLPALVITTIALIMSAALGPVIYSLIHYKRLERTGNI
jgi:uncharacterized membrane protein